MAAFEFSDADGNPIPAGEGFSSSPHFPAYKDFGRRPTDEPKKQWLAFQAPAQAFRVKVIVYAWKPKELPPLDELMLWPSYVPREAVLYGREAVDERGGLSFTATVAYEGAVRKAVALVGFRFFDSVGNVLAVDDVTGLSNSVVYKSYAYFKRAEEAGPDGRIELTKFFVRPNDAAWVTWYVVPWKVEHAVVVGQPRLDQFDTHALVGLDALASPNRFQALDADLARQLREEFSMSRAWRATAEIPPLPVGEALLEVESGQWLQLRAVIRQRRTTAGSQLWLHASFWNREFENVDAEMPGFLTSSQTGPYRPVTVAQSEDGKQARIAEPILVPEGAELAILVILQADPQDGFDVEAVHVEKGDWDTFSADIVPSHMGKDQLEALLDLAGSMFDLPLAESATWALSVLAPADHDLAYAARWRGGQVRELDTRWLPRVPTLPPYNADDDTVLHLFKVIYPDESSGGAVRSRNIVEGQAARGMQPLAAMPVGNHRFDPAQPDGPIEIESRGVRLCYSKLEAINRRHVPHDDLLNLEVSLHARVARLHRASIIHAHSGFRGYENALKGLALARQFDLPLIYEVRSFHERTWRPLEAAGLSEQITRMRMAQEDRCMREADAVVTISEAMVENLAERGIESEKIFLVPNAIGAEFAEPADEQRTDELRRAHGVGEVPVVGYISNMSAREGHLVLVEAFAHLRASFGDARLLMVGEGPEFEAVRTRAEELGVGHHVLMPGAVDHADVKSWYDLLDILVVPRVGDFASDYVTPLKPFEAMALGVPVIMSDRPVAAEIVGRQGERGLQFRTGDPANLARQLERMLRDVESTRTRAAAARDWVFRERNWKNVINRYDEAYEFARNRHAERFRRGHRS